MNNVDHTKSYLEACLLRMVESNKWMALNSAFVCHWTWGEQFQHQSFHISTCVARCITLNAKKIGFSCGIYMIHSHLITTRVRVLHEISKQRIQKNYIGHCGMSKLHWATGIGSESVVEASQRNMGGQETRVHVFHRLWAKQFMPWYLLLSILT